MRLLLMHNPTAGDGGWTRDELVHPLRSAGFEVVYRSTKSRGHERALDVEPALVVAAGGDGTIGSVARLLAGRGIPLGILPLGTANNVARSLGVDGRPARLLAALRPGTVAALPRTSLALGTASAPWGTQRVVESVGVGLLARLLREPAAPGDAQSAGSGTHKVTVGRERARAMLDRLPARPSRVVADGAALEGDYLLVELLALRSVGPRLPLANDRADGEERLSLVTLRADGRSAFGDWLDALGAGVAAPPPVEARLVRRAAFDVAAGDGHLDDEPWPDEPARAGRVEVAAGTARIEVLRPPAD